MNKTSLTLFLLIPLIPLSIIGLSLAGYILPLYHHISDIIVICFIWLIVWYCCFTFMRVDYRTS